MSNGLVDREPLSRQDRVISDLILERDRLRVEVEELKREVGRLSALKCDVSECPWAIQGLDRARAAARGVPNND